jgi:hypothetical protein
VSQASFGCAKNSMNKIGMHCMKKRHVSHCK